MENETQKASDAADQDTQQQKKWTAKSLRSRVNKNVELEASGMIEMLEQQVIPVNLDSPNIQAEAWTYEIYGILQGIESGRITAGQGRLADLLQLLAKDLANTRPQTMTPAECAADEYREAITSLISMAACYGFSVEGQELPPPHQKGRKLRI